MRPGSHPADATVLAVVVRTRLVAWSAVVLLAGLAACGGDDSPKEAKAHGCATVEGGVVTIVAKDLAWNVDCIQAPKDAAFTVVVGNKDDGVNHNLQVVLDDEVLHTKLETGPVVQRLEVPALGTGTHKYTCEIHPNMAGELEVVDQLPPG
jgi:plastocyanin